MPSVYEVEFLPGGHTVEYYGSAGLHYLWPDGTRLDMDTVPVWCLRCDRLREGENVEPIDVIDKQMADLQDPASMMYKMFRRIRRHLLADLARRRQWRVERVSPARCVSCGSTDVLVLTHERPATHPSRPLTIVARCKGLCRVGRTEWAFTPEGERIAGGHP